ncbi:MAG: hemerythrin domain-containing protein [Pelagimonas sp.]|uniref:hemerythrin domain-containing protein n=1 Tax=Pelagimonas sp. TaxID=2073170 RepID=UPI003D6A7E51
MTQYNIKTRKGLPTEMQALLRTLPRDGWKDHPNFARSIQNWMGAHQMFRDLTRLVQEDTQSFLDHDLEDKVYTGRLAHFGNLLIGNLHGHHGWEDRSFFPELEAADPRFARGLEMLESDHEELDALLDRLAKTGNRVVQLATLEPAQMYDEAGVLHETAEAIGGFLERHLNDEEDLAVPILLHHALRG